MTRNSPYPYPNPWYGRKKKGSSQSLSGYPVHVARARSQRVTAASVVGHIPSVSKVQPDLAT